MPTIATKRQVQHWKTALEAAKACLIEMERQAKIAAANSVAKDRLIAELRVKIDELQTLLGAAA